MVIVVFTVNNGSLVTVMRTWIASGPVINSEMAHIIVNNSGSLCQAGSELRCGATFIVSGKCSFPTNHQRLQSVVFSIAACFQEQLKGHFVVYRTAKGQRKCSLN